MKYLAILLIALACLSKLSAQPTENVSVIWKHLSLSAHPGFLTVDLGDVRSYYSLSDVYKIISYNFV